MGFGKGKREITGSVIVTRVNGYDGDRVDIRFTDGASHVEFAEASMTLEQFAMAVTGMYVTDVKMSVKGLARIGRRRITRTEAVEIDGSVSSLCDEQKRAACQPVVERLKKETGLKWTPYLSDIGNFHKRTPHVNGVAVRQGYNVTFTSFEKREK